MSVPFAHATIMAAEVVSALAPRAGGIYADVTLGGGGHAEAILRAEQGARVVGIDRDEAAIAASTARLAPFEGRFRAVHGAFGDAAILLPLAVRAIDNPTMAAMAAASAAANPTVHGLIADLGVSSPQLDDASRGMSLRREASSALLDMRMDRSRGSTARELIASLSEAALAEVLFELGDERRSRRIARSIKHAEESGTLATTGDLRHAVYAAVGGEKQGNLDPATRTFQALRIAVNDELGELDRLLAALPALIAEDGVAVVISFHSLEDGRVKRAFGGSDAWAPLTKRPTMASEAEVEGNPRARSAKLRAARRRRAGEEKDDRTARYAARKARKFGGTP